MGTMKEIILSTLTGFLCGAVFSLVKLPVPAPQVFAGIMGIFGIYLGYDFIRTFGLWLEAFRRFIS
jgi:XapX domain-containing protein